MPEDTNQKLAAGDERLFVVFKMKQWLVSHTLHIVTNPARFRTEIPRKKGEF